MKGRGSAMEAEKEIVKDQNWLPRPIPALSIGEEFYPEDTASPTLIWYILNGVLSLRAQSLRYHWKWKSESEIAQSCPTLCNPMDCSLPGSSIHGILQTMILEWVAILHNHKSPLVLTFSSLRHLLVISVPKFLVNTEQTSYVANTSVHSVRHFYLKSGT